MGKAKGSAPLFEQLSKALKTEGEELIGKVKVLHAAFCGTIELHVEHLPTCQQLPVVCAVGAYSLQN